MRLLWTEVLAVISMFVIAAAPNLEDRAGIAFLCALVFAIGRGLEREFKVVP